MNRFADILREADRRLELPSQVRARILLEMAADLEDLYRHCQDEGLSEPEAEEKARESFSLSDETLAALAEIHTSGLQRFFDQLGKQGSHTWERLVFVILMLFVMATGGISVFSLEVPRNAGPVGWLLIGVTVVAVTVSLGTFYVLFLREQRNLRPLRRVVASVLIMSAADLLTGLYGWWLTINGWLTGFIATEQGNLPQFIDTLLRGSAVVVVALVCVLLTSLLWYVLNTRLVLLEQNEAATLLDL